MGGWCAGEGTPKFPGRLRVSGSARRGPVSSQPYPGFLSPATLPHRSLPATQQDPPTAKKLGVTSGASAVRQNCSTLALILGDLGTTPASGAFLREAKGERSGGASSFVPADPRGPRGTSGSGGHPPGGAPRFPAGSADSARSLHPKRRARPQPGPLTDSADTQATKPKVSRIQARRIFPGARLLPAAALQRGKNEVSRPAPGAACAEGPEQSSRSDRDSGSGARAPGSRFLLLRLRLRPGNAAPSHLLVPTEPMPSCCSGEAALWSSSCSAVVVLLRGLLPRVAAPFLIFEE